MSGKSNFYKKDEEAKDIDLAEEEAGELPYKEYTISIPELFIAGATSGRFLLLFLFWRRYFHRSFLLFPTLSGKP